MTTENNKKESDWKEKFEHWLINNLQITSRSNVQLIVDHVERYIRPATPPSIEGEPAKFNAYLKSDSSLTNAEYKECEEYYLSHKINSGKEIKSKEQVAFEKFPVKLGQMSGIDLNEDERMAYLQGFRDASQFTASKEKEYTEALQSMVDEGYDAYDNAHHLVVQRWLSIATKALNK